MVAQQTDEIAIDFTPLEDSAHVYRYVALIERGSEFDCNADVHVCELVGLSPSNMYERACFMPELGKELCRLPSEVLYEWTRPEGT